MARKMITEGKAYMDDTAQEQMQQERMNHVESYRRNASVEDNLAMFEKLLKGDAEGAKYCMRAKIDMQSVNGTMRDPVMYRFNDTPHLRTGTQYKAYPTYDFACPIVDATEGVTHAMRTTEYNDREEQYYWLQNAMGLRKVNIFTFGKVNFVNTVLSKRKLNWFVEEKLVDGWFDPRFPTIQGCIRRGVNVEALKSFILGMGASKRIITMEWDKFWAENKKVLEESSARYMGVDSKDVVEFSVTNLPSIVEVVATQIHPQKPEMGTRALRRSNKLLVDQADAALYKEGEEVTFIRWGNFYIDKIIKDAEGKVLSMEGRAHPEATNFSKTKKVTWLASLPELVPCRLLEFDNIISKSKLEEDEDFKDFVNPHTKFEVMNGHRSMFAHPNTWMCIYIHVRRA
jgi:glutamyl/glutaminyl-tRNA synthetase